MVMVYAINVKGQFHFHPCNFVVESEGLSFFLYNSTINVFKTTTGFDDFVVDCVPV